MSLRSLAVVAGLVPKLVAIAAEITHIVVCINTAAWALLIIGCLFPPVGFVHGVARQFAAHPYGTYMKRELGDDLYATLFPALEREVATFVADVAERLAGAYEDASASIEGERTVVRAETLEPIERALALGSDADARREALARLRATVTRVAAIEADLARLAPPSDAAPRNGTRAALIAETVPFDNDAYDRALRPERYRVVILGA